VPTRSATVVKRLDEAGAILLGKCNLDEFAGTATGDNPWYGRMLNPWGEGRSPSGSSGGSAVAVAAHLCSGATGSDTGGSIRNPAACTGIVGLKPTRGLVSVAGTHPLCPTLDVIGPIARTSADAALLLEAMAGADPDDAITVDRNVRAFPAMLGGDISGCRVALCPDLHFATLDQGIANALTAAAKTLGNLGVAVESIGFSSPTDLAAACDVVFRAEMYATHRDSLASHPDGYSEGMARRVMDGQAISHAEYVHAVELGRNLQQTFGRMMAGLDALVLPISPSAGPPVHDGTCLVNGKQENYGRVGRTMRMWVNLLGVPALALPMGLIDGMPVGFQLVGKPFSETTLLRIGHAYEAAIGGRRYSPH
jgi:aspartyl-tRNA(Asn)/glutamyl-tRNA(Gln) amidotransferase subunit A